MDIQLQIDIHRHKNLALNILSKQSFNSTKPKQTNLIETKM